MTRRTFVKISAVTVAGSVIFSNCESPTGSAVPVPGIAVVDGLATVDFSSFPNLRNKGGTANVRIDGVNDRIVVVRVSDSQVIALSSVCTHEGCTVAFNTGAGRFDCPCHGSEFSETGAVLHGPAEVPLRKYTVQFDSSDDFLNIVVS